MVSGDLVLRAAAGQLPVPVKERGRIIREDPEGEVRVHSQRHVEVEQRADRVPVASEPVPTLVNYGASVAEIQ